ncbi:MAG TPA: hypothetical protein VHW04_08405 [Solirubrobacteraceae bacterium]|nr:hypothetical protein [Solirubrobacteraceae bacterium]
MTRFRIAIADRDLVDLQRRLERIRWPDAETVDISGMAIDTVTVPTGCSIFPKELQRPSRRWAERRFTDIRYWNEPDRGGHFAAFEQPELFVNEVRTCFRHVR